MEKQPATSKSEFSRRLLNKLSLIKPFFILFFIFSQFYTFADTLTPELIKNLVIIPSSNTELITDVEIKFEVFIPDVDPSRIDFAQPSDTDKYTFKTVRKIASTSSLYGTSIEAWIVFYNDGTFELPPLTTKINGKNYKIPFEEINIGVNPSKQKPVLIITLANGTTITSKDEYSSKPILTVKAGDEIVFTTQMQYALQLVQEKSELPKNSIFKKTKTFEEDNKKYHEKDTIGAIYPVAEYSWIPLVPGKVTFPSIRLSVMTFTGTKTEIKLPQVYVQVLESEEKIKTSNEDYFDLAFELPEQSLETIQTVNNILTEEQCRKLAELRTAERNSLFGPEKKERIEYEKALGLPSSTGEFKLPVFYIYIFFTVVFLVISILFIIRKKIILTILSGSLFVTMAIFTFYGINQVTAKYAISKGCTIQSIPEMKVESKSELPAGTRINITAQSSGWIYVELGETCGWCHEDEVIVIK